MTWIVINHIEDPYSTTTIFNGKSPVVSPVLFWPRPRSGAAPDTLMLTKWGDPDAEGSMAGKCLYLDIVCTCILCVLYIYVYILFFSICQKGFQCKCVYNV